MIHMHTCVCTVHISRYDITGLRLCIESNNFYFRPPALYHRDLSYRRIATSYWRAVKHTTLVLSAS